MTPHAYRAIRVVVLLSSAGFGTLLAAAPLPQTRELGEARCACRITVGEVARLATDTEPGLLLDIPLHIARLTDGRAVVLDQSGGRVPLVFDRAGRFLDSLGRPGAGPNEYRRPRLVVRGPGDSLAVYDASLARLTIYNPALRPIRFVQAPGAPRQLVWLPDGRFLASAEALTRETLGRPLHVFGGDGGYQGSFGPIPPVVTQTRPGPRVVIAPDREGGAWVAWEAEYRITHWRPDGQPKDTLARRVSWFPRVDAPGLGPDGPPTPRLLGLMEDASGYLWVFVGVAGSRWRDAYGPIRDLPEGRQVVVDRFDRLFDTMIEVLDPRSARVLATRRQAGLLAFPLGDGWIAGWTTTTEGNHVVRLARVGLERTPGREP